MKMLQPVRGTQDFWFEKSRGFAEITDAVRALSELYGYEEVHTPIFEFSNVFSRTLGETSDVVSKEMYSFEDRGGESLTLRPEGTAPVMRAVISGGMTQSMPLKCFYVGPMFRYERPQKGRYRQFHQFGFEFMGVASPQADAEVIALSQALIKKLGIHEGIELKLNTLGDRESRDAYRDVLVEYFSAHKAKLSKHSLDRLERNPMRIFDSKEPEDAEIVKNAPLFESYLSQESKDFFKQLTDSLDALEITYTLDPKLVRGLDYYCHTAFEFVSNTLGAQGTVLAGGRYDGLSEFMGGPKIPAIGCAGGIERLLMMRDVQSAKVRPVVFIPLGDAEQAKALILSEQLRRAGIAAELTYSGNMAKRIKKADKMQARFTLIIGDEELQKQHVLKKDMDTGAQEDIGFDQLVAAFNGQQTA